MCVLRATPASTSVLTKVTRTLASVEWDSCWTQTRELAHVRTWNVSINIWWSVLILLDYISSQSSKRFKMLFTWSIHLTTSCAGFYIIKGHNYKIQHNNLIFQVRTSVSKDTTASKSASTTSTRTLASAERDSCWTQTRELVHVSSSWLIFGLQETI